MEATFFTCLRADAVGIRAIDDLPCEPAGEPVRIESTGVFSALARTLCGPKARKVEPLRDATCQSFPVFEFEGAVSRELVGLSDDQIDEVAQAWLSDASWTRADVDLYEVASLLTDIRQALCERVDEDAALFVLLEEKAL